MDERRWVVRDLADARWAYHDGTPTYWATRQSEAKRYTLAEARAIRDEYAGEVGMRVVVRRLVSRNEVKARAEQRGYLRALGEVRARFDQYSGYDRVMGMEIRNEIDRLAKEAGNG